MEERLARFAGARDAVEPSRRSQSFDRSVTLKDRMKAFQNSPAATPPTAELDRTATIKDRMNDSTRATGESKLSTLTGRELETLRYVARGLAKKEIAPLMHISVKTVDKHVTQLMTKLDIHDRVGLARFAIREGIIEA